MSNNPEQEGGQSRQINLQDLVNQFMGGLQRHFDMLAFNLSARKNVAEADYDRLSKAVHIMPASRAHQNFEQTQAYARDLLIRQVVGDSMNLAVTCLNNAHLFLALAKAHHELAGDQQNIQQQAQESQRTFVQAPLDQKFDRLEKDYDIRCELEDTLISLGFIAQGFMRQKSAVESSQTDDNGELVVELKTVDPEAIIDPEIAPIQPKLIDQKKVFREGEKIFFTDNELQLILVTLGSFAQNLFHSVAQYAREMKEG
tara:strand:- start:2229 stop:2999 length:771 start_codon:yes stop_codon:yes gene_type:complete